MNNGGRGVKKIGSGTNNLQRQPQNVTCDSVVWCRVKPHGSSRDLAMEVPQVPKMESFTGLGETLAQHQVVFKALYAQKK